VTVNRVGAASNGSIIVDFQDEDDKYGMLVMWLYSYLGKNSVTHSTTNTVRIALGSKTGFRGKVQRLFTTSTTPTHVDAGVFIRGVRKN